MITVSLDGTGDFTSINAAIQSITSYPEEIFVKSGTYNEVVELTHSDVTITGENRENTIITYNNYGFMPADDAKKLGTFRSYTFLALGDNISLNNLTITNSAGFGSEVGQAIALFADGNNINVDNCILSGHQDTLFTGPLPKKEKEAGGFMGPTEFMTRKIGTQSYTNCYICGEVDFIFGSAVAYFDNCDIFCLDRTKEINGYVTAPSTYEGCEYGYVFNNCRITGNCPQDSFYLGRPWREYAKTVFLNCHIDSHICPEAFHDWEKLEAHKTVYFGLYNCDFKNMSDKLPEYVHILTDAEASKYAKEKVLSYHFDKEYTYEELKNM